MHGLIFTGSKKADPCLTHTGISDNVNCTPKSGHGKMTQDPKSGQKRMTHNDNGAASVL